MQWFQGQQNLQTFLEIANNFLPTIKFTSDISNEQHIFLDTVSRIESGKLIVDLYSKPTDKHQYLLPSSCHPKQCIQNIPYSLALRIRRICSRECDFQVRANELSKQFQSSGYNIHLPPVTFQRQTLPKGKNFSSIKQNQVKLTEFPLLSLTILTCQKYTKYLNNTGQKLNPRVN